MSTTTDQADPVAESYANDPRVVVSPAREDRPPSYAVTPAPGDQPYHIIHSGLLGWCVYQDPGMQLVQMRDGDMTDAHFAIGIGTAGEVIAFLLQGAWATAQ